MFIFYYYFVLNLYDIKYISKDDHKNYTCKSFMLLQKVSSYIIKYTFNPIIILSMAITNYLSNSEHQKHTDVSRFPRSKINNSKYLFLCGVKTK